MFALVDDPFNNCCAACVRAKEGLKPANRERTGIPAIQANEWSMTTASILTQSINRVHGMVKNRPQASIRRNSGDYWWVAVKRGRETAGMYISRG